MQCYAIVDLPAGRGGSRSPSPLCAIVNLLNPGGPLSLPGLVALLNQLLALLGGLYLHGGAAQSGPSSVVRIQTGAAGGGSRRGRRTNGRVPGGRDARSSKVSPPPGLPRSMQPSMPSGTCTSMVTDWTCVRRTRIRLAAFQAPRLGPGVPQARPWFGSPTTW